MRIYSFKSTPLDQPTLASSLPLEALGVRGKVKAGTFDKDILLVAKAIKPRHNHIVVAIVDGDFTVKQLHQRNGWPCRLILPRTVTSATA